VDRSGGQAPCSGAGAVSLQNARPVIKWALGLCGGMSDARFVSTTEVYPDSPLASAAQCNEAQAVTITAAIDYLMRA
jgi:hypothetical protein